jgi:hypothetical protein
MDRIMNLPKLMPLLDWAKARFTKPPCEKTLYKEYTNEPYVVRRGGRWWVDIELEAKLTGNPLVDKVLTNG